MISEKAFPLVKGEHATFSAAPSLPADTDEVTKLRKTLAVNPGDWASHYNLGVELRQHMRLAEAGYHLAKAAESVPADSPSAATVHGALSINLLQTGNFALGWTEYEWRHRGPIAEHTAPFDALAPRWDGSSPPQELLLFHYEQGLGDTINFCRYLKYPILQGARVILFCQPPLRRLMAQSYGQYVYVLPGDSLPKVSRQASLLSMPYLMTPHVGSHIPAEVPYLAATPEDIARIRPQIDALSCGRPRIGLAWRGNPDNPTDGRRSVPPQKLRVLLSLDADFYAIQPDAKIEELRELGFTNIHSLADRIRDFADTAAALSVLDGLVSVDTSVVHLAGALNRPVWMPLAWPSDWRWGIESETTAWYPSVRMFRSKPAADWDDTIAALVSNLRDWLAAR